MLENGPFGEADARIIIRQVMEGLDYLHKKQIAHRDLKLENIMFTSQHKADLTVKLIDFGFASKFEKEKGMTLVLGSPLFMAPELVLKKVYSEKVDVWALGVLTYILLTACQPFGGTSIPEIHQNTLSKQLKFQGKRWDFISDYAISFILTCLDREQTSRPSISDLFKHQWMTMQLEEEG